VELASGVDQDAQAAITYEEAFFQLQTEIGIARNLKP
jgi:hypothetical protein